MARGLMSRLKRTSWVVAAGAAGIMGLSAVVAAAQETAVDTVRPASIHAGACDNPGEVVAELRELVVMFDDDGGGNGAAPATGTDDGGDDDADDGGSAGSGDDDAADDSGGAVGDDADDGGDAAADDGAGEDDADDGADDRDDDGADDSDDNGNGDDDDNGESSLTGTFLYRYQTGGELAGAQDASVVEGSEDSEVGVALDDLLAEPHIVAVFERDGSDTIIACGAIGGFVSGDDTLAVGLRTQGGSGVAGIALFDDDDDDDELDVDVYIGRDVAGA